MDVDVIEVEAEIHREHNVRTGRMNNNNTNNNDGNNSSGDSNNDNNSNNNNQINQTNRPKEICWFWENRNCKFQNKCRKEHPERCRVFIETGHCRESRCRLLHPKICRNHFFNGNCTRGNLCRFVHTTKNSNGRNNMTHNNEYSTNNQQQYNSQQNNLYTNQGWNQSFGNFLGMWPTPMEASVPMKMMISQIMEKIAMSLKNM